MPDKLQAEFENRVNRPHRSTQTSNRISRSAVADTVDIPARNYNLGATLSSGQAFRWHPEGDHWYGVLDNRCIRLRSTSRGIRAEGPALEARRSLLETYLQTTVDLSAVLPTFPVDANLQKAVAACPGLRLLRQDPWECLASFLMSSNKQVVHIQQILAMLCEQFGESLPTPRTWPVPHSLTFTFPSPERLAAASETSLRACRMGYRAPYLQGSARLIADGTIDLEALRDMPYEAAREILMSLPGVGRKIADCVLLFAYGFQRAFPVDVWIQRALRELYFAGRKATPSQLLQFAENHFGPYGGYAQQYLFHYMRIESRRARTPQTASNAA